MAGTNRRRLSNHQRRQLRLARDNARSCAENLVRRRYIEAERDCRLCSLALEHARPPRPPASVAALVNRQREEVSTVASHCEQES